MSSSGSNVWRKWALRSARQGAGLYWRVYHPITLGVRIILVRNETEVLLVRHSYGSHGTYLPGGRVRRRETLVAAIRRELEEEVALTPGSYSDLELHGVYTNFREGKSDHVVVFRSSTSIESVSSSTSAEIEHAAFYSLAKLPADVSRGTVARLVEYQNLGKVTPFDW